MSAEPGNKSPLDQRQVGVRSPIAGVLRTRQLLFTGVALALISVGGAIAIGVMADHKSREALLVSIYDSNLGLAESISFQLETMPATASRDELLERVADAWAHLRKRYEGSYLCVVGDGGALALHSAAPDQVGQSTAEVPLLNPRPGGPRTIGELVKSEEQYVGAHRNWRGEDQVVAFAYSARLRALLAIHVPQLAVDTEIKKTRLPWAVGLGLVVGGLLPLALGLFLKAARLCQRDTDDALQALAASEAQYRDLLEHAADPITVAGPDGRHLAINQRARELFGYTGAEFLGSHVTDQFAPGELERLPLQVAAIGTGESIRIERRIVRKGGELRWIESSARRLGDGRVESIHRDISDRKIAEERLRESQVLLHTVIDNAPVVLWSLDENGVFLLSEGRGLVALDLKPGEVVGQSLFDLDAGAPEILERNRRALAGEPQRWTTESNGRSWESFAHPVEESALSPARVIGLAIDTTDRVRAESALRSSQQQLLQSQKMDAIGRLAGGIAHDFNNLLTAISGYAELLKERIKADESSRRSVEEISRAAARAASLTQQLLAFSRRQILQPRRLSLNSVLGDSAHMFRRLIGANIEVIVLNHAVTDTVRADPAQIEQVLLNLALNARDAMPAGGKLTMETQYVETDDASQRQQKSLQPGAYVLVAVSDTGCGIDPEVLPHIFEPFFTTKEQGKGTGLGLSTVEGIVSQSGGHISVYSEPGLGSTFKVYLPHAESGGESDSNPLLVIPRRGTETVLVVEDEYAVKLLVHELLTGYGYQVLMASDSAEALALCDRGLSFDMLLTDVIMPGMSGKELAEKLVARNPSLKVLFMSGYTADAIVNHGTLDPGTHFLQKPFSVVTLLRQVRAVLD